MLGSCVRPSTTGAYAAAAGWRRTIAGSTSTSATSETVVPLGSLRYPPPHSEEAVTGAGPTGYKPPLGNTDALPFRVLRTKSGRLPIYTDYKNGRTKKITILRKFSGDRKVNSAPFSAHTPAHVVKHCQSQSPPARGRSVCAAAGELLLLLLVVVLLVLTGGGWCGGRARWCRWRLRRSCARRCGECWVGRRTPAWRSWSGRVRSRSRATTRGSSRCGSSDWASENRPPSNTHSPSSVATGVRTPEAEGEEKKRWPPIYTAL